MTISSLVLTDGTTTATLTDGTNYALASGGWAPQIARRRTAELGGVGPYEDVEEQIQIDIISTPRSLATTLANVAKIQSLLDQARRWRLGQNVAAVQLQFTMTGGTMKEAAILDGALDLPSSFADLLVVQEVAVATLRLTRRGLWLGAVETVSAAPFGALIFTDSKAPAPTTITYTTPSYGLSTSNSIIAITSSDGLLPISRIPATTGVIGPFTNVADVTAIGGTVLRYTPAGVTAQKTASIQTVLSFITTYVYATVRNNSATTTWKVSMTERVYGNAEYEHPPIQIDVSTTAPRLIYLGSIRGVKANGAFVLKDIRISVTASAAAGTLDFNTVLFVSSKTLAPTIVALPPATTVINATGLKVVAMPNRDVTPSVTAVIGAADNPIAYSGDAAAYTDRFEVYTMWYGVSNGGWTVPTPTAMSASRPRTHLTPE